MESNEKLCRCGCGKPVPPQPVGRPGRPRIFHSERCANRVHARMYRERNFPKKQEPVHG
jgi:hypothetical protein